MGLEGREVGGEGEGSKVKGGGKWGLGTPCSPPLSRPMVKSIAEGVHSTILSTFMF